MMEWLKLRNKSMKFGLKIACVTLDKSLNFFLIFKTERIIGILQIMYVKILSKSKSKIQNRKIAFRNTTHKGRSRFSTFNLISQ